MDSVSAEQAAFELAWRMRMQDDEGNVPTSGPARSNHPQRTYVGDAAEYAWKWWKLSRAHAPKLDASRTALDRYMSSDIEDDTKCPIERLRFFCSLAMSDGDDWLASEPLFDALYKHVVSADAIAEIEQYRERERAALQRAESDGREADAARYQQAINGIDFCMQRFKSK